MVQTCAEALMGAEADAVCGAASGERSEEPRNTRNGYRRREWDIRVGSISLAIPKLRRGSYFPDSAAGAPPVAGAPDVSHTQVGVGLGGPCCIASMTSPIPPRCTLSSARSWTPWKRNCRK